jgi:hypothetical protein
MRADLGSFLEYAHGNLRVAFRGELFQSNRSGEPGRTRADDYDVVLHRFTF